MPPAPRPPSPLHLQARDLLARRDHAQAEPLLRRILTRDPTDAEALFHLTRILAERGDFPQARFFAEKFALRDPINGTRLLGRILVSLRDNTAAVEQFQKALAACPPSYISRAEIHIDLANTYVALARTGDAHAAYSTAIDLARRLNAPPATIAPALSGLSQLLAEVGRTHEAIDLAREAVRLCPADPRFAGSFAFLRNYDDRASAADLLRDHIALGSLYSAALNLPAPGIQQPFPPRPPITNRPLRVGLLSANFREHSVAYFITPILEHADPAICQWHAFSASSKTDDFTDRLKRHAATWRQVHNLDDAAINSLLRSENLDILIELGGHTRGTRIAALTRQVAPIVITYCAYPNTTGMPGITHRIVDAISDPPSATPTSTEQLVRIPGCFLCYTPPADAPDPTIALPPDSPPVFGSFNALGKLGPATLDLWSRLLRETPNARLLLKSKPLADAWTREQLTAAFASRGVSPDRLDFLARIDSRADHLAAYSRIHIALDPTPYTGTTTTCEALWMGVPVITLRLPPDRATHASRVSESLLHAAGLPQFIADSPDSYIQKAQSLTQDLTQLRTLRTTLRPQLNSSTLCNAERFASNFLKILTTLANQ
jgi:protein O-GlcNAc transferase